MALAAAPCQVGVTYKGIVSTVARHEISRIRREIRRRQAVESALADLSARMRRVTFSSPDFADFESASHDDHVKLFFPATTAGSTDRSARDYTPRYFDIAQRTLTIDFVLHADGPATSWARQARVGDGLEIAGPRGSTVVPDDFDWYLLVGDTSALPAIGRRVEELRPAVPVTTLVTVEDGSDAQVFATRAEWRPHWVARGSDDTDDAGAIIRALEGVEFGDGDGFVWVAAETAVARAVRRHLLDVRRQPVAWLKASAYWTRGGADREPIGDDAAK